MPHFKCCKSGRSYNCHFFLSLFYYFYFIFVDFPNHFSCEICFEPFQATSLPGSISDRRPRKLCPDGHSFCFRCCRLNEPCPTCGLESIEPPEVNLDIIVLIETFTKLIHKSIPEIESSQVEQIGSHPIATGACADVYHCKWGDISVAVKQLRFKPKQVDMKSIRYEAGLGINLRHPNIVQLFGLVHRESGYMGIVMEWADKGSLRDRLDELTSSQKIKIPLGVTNGLEYLHGKRIAHKDLKPENILLIGQTLKPKIADFGTSKEIQTSMKSTTVAGTVQYLAPELADIGGYYGVPVDVYSLSIMLYEIFSGIQPFKDYNIMQIMRAHSKNERPKFPADFHGDLKELISRGWQIDPSLRPSTSECQSLLSSMLLSIEDSDQRQIGNTN